MPDIARLDGGLDPKFNVWGLDLCSSYFPIKGISDRLASRFPRLGGSDRWVELCAPVADRAWLVAGASQGWRPEYSSHGVTPLMGILIYIFAFFVWTTISALLAAAGDISGGFMFAFMLHLMFGFFKLTWLFITTFFALTECAFGFLRTRWRVPAFAIFEAGALCLIAIIVAQNDPFGPYAFKKIFYPALGVAIVYFLRSASRIEPISFRESDEATSAD